MGLRLATIARYLGIALVLLFALSSLSVNLYDITVSHPASYAGYGSLGSAASRLHKGNNKRALLHPELDSYIKARSSSSIGFWIQLDASDDACVVALPPDSNPPESAPVRIGSCASSGDWAVWHLTSDGNGRSYAYSQGMGGDQSRRLDFVQPDGMPAVAILGPSDAKYHNQHWSFPSPGSPGADITSYGRPGAALTTTHIGDIVAVIVSEVSGSAAGNTKWRIVSPVAVAATETTHNPDSTSSSAAATPSAVESGSASGVASPSSSDTETPLPTRLASAISPPSTSASASVSSLLVSVSASSSQPPPTSTVGRSPQPSDPPSPTTQPHRGHASTAVIVGAAVGSSAGLFLACAVIFCLWKRSKHVSLGSGDSEAEITMRDITPSEPLGEAAHAWGQSADDLERRFVAQW